MSATNFNVDITACREAFLARQQKTRAEREARRLAAIEAVRQAIRECMPGYPSVQRAYLFGSVVRLGAFRLDSDVDVAVEGIGVAEYFDLWRDLEQTAPEWTIDLRDITRPSLFAERVRATGLLIYERDGADSQS
ncbi:MAG: nucleotidyltransferase domain-containing protein [Vicinamibacterales bacterium]